VPLPTPIKVKKLAFYLEGCHKTRYNELTLGNICEKSNSKNETRNVSKKV